MKPFLKNLPDAPGAYLMKNREGKVVYVGKAVSLKKRVRSYFTPRKGRDFRLAERYLADQVEDVDFIVTRNETEAFILENNLIKKLKPQYNIRLKDDKTFLSLKVNMSHPFPSIVPVRRPKRDGCLYFGPYSSARALRSTLRTIRTVVPLRDCSDREFQNRSRPCIKHEIGRCPAPCVGRIDRTRYRAHLDKAMAILKGNVDELICGLEGEMKEASESMAFEQAAGLRDQIGHLKDFARSQRVEGYKFYDVDVIGTYGSQGLTEVVVLFFREGKLTSSQPYTFDLPLSEEELIGQFLLRFYDNNRYVPEKTFIPTAIPDMKGIEAYLKERRKASYELRAPDRGDAKKLVQMAGENARLSLKASRQAQEGVARLQESLRARFKLTRTPVAVEGVDISTTGGTEAVGSIVHFKAGSPVKSRYRKYRIKTVKGMDDYAMLHEVVCRRLRRGIKEKDLPDLILVDGGKGQLKSAVKAAHDLGVTSVDFLAIEKGTTRARAVHVAEGADDKIIAPPGVDAKSPPAGSAELHLLQRVRDEAHRFAVAYHRKRRGKAGMASPLDRIKGLGPARKRALLSQFGGLRGLRGASKEEINRVPGLGSTLAERLYKVLHE